MYVRGNNAGKTTWSLARPLSVTHHKHESEPILHGPSYVVSVFLEHIILAALSFDESFPDKGVDRGARTLSQGLKGGGVGAGPEDETA